MGGKSNTWRLASVLSTVLVLSACGEPEGRGEIEGAAVPADVIADREARQGSASRIPSAEGTQILFGDLHVHTTFSPDAFVVAVPLMGGSGLHPPADACDFARYCSNLDFWSINDHAEGLTPRRWEETRKSSGKLRSQRRSGAHDHDCAHGTD